MCRMLLDGMPDRDTAAAESKWCRWYGRLTSRAHELLQLHVLPDPTSKQRDSKPQPQCVAGIYPCVVGRFALPSYLTLDGPCFDDGRRRDANTSYPMSTDSARNKPPPVFYLHKSQCGPELAFVVQYCRERESGAGARGAIFANTMVELGSWLLPQRWYHVCGCARGRTRPHAPTARLSHTPRWSRYM